MGANRGLRVISSKHRVRSILESKAQWVERRNSTLEAGTYPGDRDDEKEDFGWGGNAKLFTISNYGGTKVEESSRAGFGKPFWSVEGHKSFDKFF
jgi:hypothetical protein